MVRLSLPSSSAPSLVGLKQPSILRRLVSYLDWPSFHAILSTSRDFRSLFLDPTLRNSILARFVPGFDTFTFRDSAVSQESLLSIDLHQLHLFLISQRVPVQTYPTHALRFMFSLVPYVDKSESLVALTQAHSRFVLLLQSLVYTSQNLVFPSEAQHVLPPILSEKFASPVLELTSPAPLSYKASTPPPSTPPQRNPPLSKSKLDILSGSTRRLSKSLFKSPSLPPPVAEPFALRVYSSTWRRSIPYRNPSEISQSDSDNELVPPRRRYVPSTPTSSNSQSSLSRSSTPTPPTSNSSPSPPPSRLRLALSSLSVSSPYDFIHALSPARAPVLRTYVPCSAPHLHPHIIVRCEEQLIDADLWSYLSVGDIVANLGHVPLLDEPEKPTNASDKIKRSSLHRHKSSPPPTNWLLFNGTILVPFSPQPGVPIPVPDALTLPSPFYYTHILPRFANPIFLLRRMPRFSTVIPSSNSDGTTYEETVEPAEGDIPMRLVYLPVRVPTTHGGGIALVRRYKWLARVFVNAPREGELELGQGWQGEWIVEGEGTKEGREALIDWLLGRGRAQGRVEGKGKGREQDRTEVEWEWELVRERCQNDRMWFKLLTVRTVGEEGSETMGADREDVVGF
ncbi:hypothetical protein H2248_008473 [Termitomyces sp. 'cryptogamus']|nr:hypothetical protein H2248_008473 [Termitomyces sp. 'cryptogamus']